jgi:transcriptional regulator with XRE-family HTH domain
MIKKNFKDITDEEPSKVHEHISFLKANKAWVKKSMQIAVGVLKVLREKNISQNTLAEKLNVSPQYVNKILKGNENLTLETITKIEEILNIQLINIITVHCQTEVIVPQYLKVYSKQTKPKRVVPAKKAAKVKTLNTIKQ